MPKIPSLYVTAVGLVVEVMPENKKVGRTLINVMKEGEQIVDRMSALELLNLISNAFDRYMERKDKL